MLSLLNKKDANHGVATEFLEWIHKENAEGRPTTAIISSHCVFEVNTVIRREKRAGKFEGIKSTKFVGPDYYPVDVNLIKRAQETPDLYDHMSLLRSQDAIYFVIAFLEKFPLVTFDKGKGFEKVKDHIEVCFVQDKFWLNHG